MKLVLTVNIHVPKSVLAGGGGIGLWLNGKGEQNE